MKTVIITAGGIGSRMESELPKQFLLLKKKPILMLTLERFHSYDSKIQIILTLPSTWVSYWNDLLAHYQFKIPHQIVEGGKERFHSIKNALEIVKGEIVGVHDGVRPLVSLETIAACFDSAEKFGAAIPFLPINESMRQLTAEGSNAVMRNEFVCVQTPQCFKKDLLIDAYQQDFHNQFTDDASVVESKGIEIKLVPGNLENIKITTQNDLKIAELFI